MKRAKQKYEKPTMQIYELRGRTRLLVGSDGTEDYNRNPTYYW